MDEQEVTHLYTKETLYHYTCGQCGNWWSYAATPHPYDLKDPHYLSELTCPHCGHHAHTEKKAGATSIHGTPF
jgi:DNA-directed RNA polymerase subunit RPC12/RpoP